MQNIFHPLPELRSHLFFHSLRQNYGFSSAVQLITSSSLEAFAVESGPSKINLPSAETSKPGLYELTLA